MLWKSHALKVENEVQRNISLLPSGMHMHSQMQPGAAVCETTAGRMDMLMPPSESAQLGHCHDVAPLSFGVVCGKVCVDSL